MAINIEIDQDIDEFPGLMVGRLHKVDRPAGFRGYSETVCQNTIFRNLLSESRSWFCIPDGSLVLLLGFTIETTTYVIGRSRKQHFKVSKKPVVLWEETMTVIEEPMEIVNFFLKVVDP